ncbi:MAG: anthranilate phosphoribosyltransferase [Candidatus Omnitrophica bacterium]|nr:anthranilate phosphoribosyltransferase [Candidatus Omnitrophota bacterium]MBU4303501.1 anthranilate phosphoribosyltransferase [Candidatus Omnitrophota bacterium]MBU4418361.1 anthranilate phosphoribosyltransferase [Candidatus Omnitrophota bacterium]MBU4467438.1 anthranilate phosphoribosyltransferase [Candidatus Omnitrophota bacterium]MCG2708533.1 anthranilate phosphoribosyltransferase [Candidatus Omnitrophota bacterium]
MIKDSTKQLLSKKDLTDLQMQQVMREILSGTAATADIVAFLTALNAKGETVAELTAAVNVMLKYVEPIIVDKPNILDTCGTGGDKKGTFNISTLSALVACGAGVTVAKHGNRSVSSKCGSADILEALGVNINMDTEKIKRCLVQIGIAFLFAPNLHLAMRYVMPARKQIAQKTIFNILGPLINPARATNQLIGVYARQWVRPLAEVLRNLGSKHILVVHGADGLDEVTTTDKTFVTEVNGGILKDYEIVPEDFGFKRASPNDLLGGSIDENVKITQELLKGKPGSCRDIVLFNAGCAIYAADKTDTIAKGIKLAQESIDSGAALEKLKLLKEYSQ